MDVICQAKSGMGKTAVFVIATLQQLEPEDGRVAALVLCHTRELAYQVGVGCLGSVGGRICIFICAHERPLCVLNPQNLTPERAF